MKSKKYIFQTNLTNIERYKLTVRILLLSGIIRRLSLFLTIPLIFIVTYITTTTTENIGLGIIWETLPMLIFPLLLLFILFILPIFGVLFGKKNNPRYEFDDWGMTLINKDKTLNVPWQNLEAYLETGEYIFLQTTKSKMYGHVIQKSMLEDGIPIKEFIDYLGEQRLKRK
jgi:hypothetical protein